MSPDEFWGLSPHECMEWIRHRRNGVSDMAMIQAWKTAIWQRTDAKKLPQNIRDILGREPDDKPKTKESVAHKVMGIFRAMAVR